MSLKPAHFADEEFTEILRWRLGIAHPEFVNETDPILCQNAIASPNGLSGEVMNKYCDHAVCCSNGPLRFRRREDIADCAADMIDDTAAHVRREASIKTFCPEKSDAWLDIWAFGGMHLPELIIDVTIRHPMVTRYQPRAASIAGAPAAMAEEDKQKRYPSTRTVTAFAIETWARLGDIADIFCLKD